MRSGIYLFLFLIVLGSNLLALENDDDLRSQMILGEEMFHLNEFDKAREIFEKVIKKDMKNPQAHLYLGLIEYEKGSLERAKTRFQIAYECLIDAKDIEKMPNPDQIQLEFSDKDKVWLYNKDGWYLRQKNPEENQSVLLLDSGSNYKVLFKPTSKMSLLSRIFIASTIALSFLFVR